MLFKSPPTSIQTSEDYYERLGGGAGPALCSAEIYPIAEEKESPSYPLSSAASVSHGIDTPNEESHRRIQAHNRVPEVKLKLNSPQGSAKRTRPVKKSKPDPQARMQLQKEAF